VTPGSVTIAVIVATQSSQEPPFPQVRDTASLPGFGKLDVVHVEFLATQKLSRIVAHASGETSRPWSNNSRIGAIVSRLPRGNDCLPGADAFTALAIMFAHPEASLAFGIVKMVRIQHLLNLFEPELF